MHKEPGDAVCDATLPGTVYTDWFKINRDDNV